ncbi:alpha/beta hydrolase fold domain-containing protein [Ornithinimicrobium sediminis]|uniref:alpha/beta hydrolase fold domain-containing protein n=1 Tax=Ornithinimicrobium sediminis TaxID=2904603 RepID=UPI001E47932C|nr:alpha/beta hydrolase [Ornithinimicrobium sediminis]MCE0486769.1 alpha/beta hydrolase [Ornithinimicrobium sediminis]
MPSWQTRAVGLYLRATRKRRYASAERGRRSMSAGLPAAAPPAHLGDRLTSEVVDGFEVTTVTPAAGALGGGHLLYLHGGAFVNGIARQHWALVAELAEATQRAVHVARYGLLPEHDADDAAGHLEALHRHLAPQGPLHVLGDSAGGNLALLLAQAQAGGGTVVGLTLVAPWLDLSMSNPEVDALEPHDPWLTRAGLRPIAAAWAGTHDLRSPAVSPLFGRLDALPPTAVLVGDRDICLPDCRVLCERATSQPPPVLHVEAGSPHVYPLLPTPEGRRGRQVIVDHVRSTFA